MSGERNPTAATHTADALRSPPLPPFDTLRESPDDRTHGTRSLDLPHLLEDVGGEFVEVRPRLSPVETLPVYRELRLPSSNQAGPSSHAVTGRKRGRDSEGVGPISGSSPRASPTPREPTEDSVRVEARCKRRRLNNNTSSPAVVASVNADVRDLANTRPRPVVPPRLERSSRISATDVLEAGEVIEDGYRRTRSSLPPHRERPRRVRERDELREIIYRRTRRSFWHALQSSMQTYHSVLVASARPSSDGTQRISPEGVVRQAAAPDTVVDEEVLEEVLDVEQTLESGTQRVQRTGSQNSILNSAIPQSSDLRRRYRYSGLVMRGLHGRSNPSMRSTAFRPRVQDNVSPRSMAVESTTLPHSTSVAADSVRRAPGLLRTSRRLRLADFFRNMNARDLASIDDQMMRQRNAAPKAVIAALPEKVATESDTEIRCAICMCDVEVGENLRILPCTHRYHKKCIEGMYPHDLLLRTTGCSTLYLPLCTSEF